jgi:DNA-binding transcriptional ArsR family regulator
MRKPTADQPITALRAALGAPWPPLRLAALRILRQALKAETFGDAAIALGVSRRALERLREDFPEAFKKK